jgi:hypothetical protein
MGPTLSNLQGDLVRSHCIEYNLFKGDSTVRYFLTTLMLWDVTIRDIIRLIYTGRLPSKVGETIINLQKECISIVVDTYTSVVNTKLSIRKLNNAPVFDNENLHALDQPTPSFSASYSRFTPFRTSSPRGSCSPGAPDTWVSLATNGQTLQLRASPTTVGDRKGLSTMKWSWPVYGLATPPSHTATSWKGGPNPFLSPTSSDCQARASQRYNTTLNSAHSRIPSPR